MDIFVFRELLGEFRLQHLSYRLVSAFVVLLLDQKIYSLQLRVVQPYRHYAQRDSIYKLYTIYIRLSARDAPCSECSYCFDALSRNPMIASVMYSLRLPQRVLAKKETLFFAKQSGLRQVF